MTHTEALRLALDALSATERFFGHANYPADRVVAALEAIRAALSAPAAPAEPVAPALDWPAMLLLLNEYAMHAHDASEHQAESRADISKTAALKSLERIRMAMAAHDSRWRALVHELIWRATPAALSVPAGWVVRNRSDLEPGAIDIKNPRGVRLVLDVTRCTRSADGHMLYELASALLAAAPQPGAPASD